MANTYLLGEKALVFDLNITHLSQIQRQQLIALAEYLISSQHFYDVVPAQSSITAYIIDQNQADNWLAHIEQMWSEVEQLEYKHEHHTLEVKYGGKYGPDLAYVAHALDLPEHEVIRLHCDALYHVEFLGFLPGFAYLTGLPKQLCMARKNTPRTKVPKGSVAIAESLTSVYPSSSPGGWHLIGTTQQWLFDAKRPHPSLFKPGDTVQFIPYEGEHEC